MTDLTIVLAVAAGTYALRISFIAYAGERRIPALVTGLLENIKPAALAALAATAVASHDGVGPGHLVALIAAAVVARRGGDMLIALFAGAGFLALGNLLW